MQDQIQRAENALCFYAGVIRNLKPWFPELYSFTSMMAIDYLIHPVERKLKRSWHPVREQFAQGGLVIGPTVLANPVTARQVLFYGGLFVTTLDQIAHDVESFAVLDAMRNRTGHPMSLLRYMGAKLMALRAVYGFEHLSAEATGDSANIMVQLGEHFKYYYTDNEWFGVGNPKWKK